MVKASGYPYLFEPSNGLAHHTYTAIPVLDFSLSGEYFSIFLVCSGGQGGAAVPGGRGVRPPHQAAAESSQGPRHQRAQEKLIQQQAT